MLHLRRAEGEWIVIGEGGRRVRLVVLGIDGDRVRIGLEAARGVPIDRAEIRRAKDAARAAKGGER